jgi:hypothetical protein
LKRKITWAPDSEEDQIWPAFTRVQLRQFWKPLRENRKRVRAAIVSVRKVLIAEGAADADELDDRIGDFLQQIGISLDVTRWKNDARSQHSLNDLIASIDEACASLDYPPNSYLISVANPTHQGFPDAGSLLFKVREMAVRAQELSLDRAEKPAFETHAGAVMAQLDAFLQEITGRRLNQKKWILVNTTRGAEGGKIGTRVRSFPYAVLNRIAPRISDGEIVTALKHYISKRNAEEQIPSHGRPAGAKNKEPKENKTI